METLKDKIRHILDYDSEETVALTFKTKARLVRNIVFTIETYYEHLQPVTTKTEQETNEQPKRVSAEEFKNKIYDKIRDDLKDARMEGWNTDDGDKYPLLDFLSKGNTIEGGLSEIDNIVEQIDIDDLIERFASQHPEHPVTDEEIESVAEQKFQGYDHKEFSKMRWISGAKWMRDKSNNKEK